MSAPISPPSLRLWPGILIVCLQWLLRFAIAPIWPDALPVGVFGAMGCALLIWVWWAFVSRAPIFERWFAIVAMLGGLAAAPSLLHESVATSMMGLMFFVYATPPLCLAFVAWAFLTKTMPKPKRAVTLVTVVIVACSPWTLIRTEGFNSELNQQFAWRWSDSREDKLGTLAAQGAAQNLANDNTKVSWPGFRGANRDNRITGSNIASSWSDDEKPVEIWRRPVGPAWSSFSVAGEYLFTQEQRGENEVVSCYKLSSGEAVWTREDATRFWEANAGPGPRATPTYHAGRLYTLGANGTVNALDAADGALVWTRDLTADSGVAVPGWGFSGSPLLIEDALVVAAAGKLVGYNRDSGDLLWQGPNGMDGYSSPHLVTLSNVPQVLLASRNGLVSVEANSGKLLWNHDWPGGSRIVQPALLSSGDILLSRGEKSGMARIRAYLTDGEWKTEEVWRTNRLKPYFSDFVVRDDSVYGFDGSYLVCMDVATGDRIWRGGRYGSGQVLLLEDQDLLLVVSEKGEVALVRASSSAFEERGRFQAIEGKTWNHPVLVGDTLLVRNDTEMAAFRLP